MREGYKKNMTEMQLLSYATSPWNVQVSQQSSFIWRWCALVGYIAHVKFQCVRSFNTSWIQAAEGPIKCRVRIVYIYYIKPWIE